MNVRIVGADLTATNNNGSGWTHDKLVCAIPCRLFKLSVSNIGGTDCYLWIFDSATAATAAPVHVRLIPAGYADTWDFGPDGGVFVNGLYVIAGTNAPADLTTNVVGAGNNKVIFKADYREY